MGDDGTFSGGCGRSGHQGVDAQVPGDVDAHVPRGVDAQVPRGVDAHSGCWGWEGGWWWGGWWWMVGGGWGWEGWGSGGWMLRSQGMWMLTQVAGVGGWGRVGVGGGGGGGCLAGACETLLFLCHLSALSDELLCPTTHPCREFLPPHRPREMWPADTDRNLQNGDPK